ncbi:MAG: hypothetical protein KC485_12260 [Gemmatimonadetes bacterium]|nr:hypothetical protein [Gemmatimonadota bacterium]
MAWRRIVSIVCIGGMLQGCASTRRLDGGDAQQPDTTSSASTAVVLSPTQLRADFDQAIGYITAVAVHADLNARRFGIDYPRELAALRAQITDSTDVCTFARLLDKALNLVLDLHAGTMSYEYLRAYGTLQSRFNISEDEDYASVAALERQCPVAPPALMLPVEFIDGHYVVYADVAVRGTVVPRGTWITSYNGEEIASFIRRHLTQVRPVQVDQGGTVYSLRFYRAGEPAFRLGLSDGRELVLRLDDSVTWQVPRTHDITYFSQPRPRVLHFAEQRTLYIGIPMMDEDVVEGITASIDSLVRAGATIERIAIDIRGNGGGSDLTWRRVVSHLVDRDLAFALDLRMKDNPLTRGRYPRQPRPEATPIALLGGVPYWVHNDDVVTFGPDSTSLRFQGPIYVLRDRYIYSSAGNFADFASQDPQFTTVGAPTDLVGGAQIEPLFFRLDHSGIVFRLEPALDFSGVRTLDDFAHNTVEVTITPSVEDLFLRSTFAGDIYDRDFLLEHDPLFRYVVARPPQVR